MAVRVATRRVRRGRVSLAPLVFLGFAVLGGFVLIKGQPAPAPVAMQPQITVTGVDAQEFPVPEEPVPAGTRLRDVRLRKATAPRHLVPSDAMLSIDGMEDAVAVAVLPAGLPLLKKNFQKGISVGNAVVDKIPQGMRAMTIQVDATSAVEGWAGSGSLVDVLLVEKDRTSVVAEKVRILSAARSVNPVEGPSAPNPPSTVTILVSQEQCLAINTAIPRGRIALALRSQLDDQRWASTSYTAEQLRSGTKVISETPKINGFASVREGEESKTFALSEGRWIESLEAPSGFVERRSKEPARK